MSRHDYEGVMLGLCTPLQVKCYPIWKQIAIEVTKVIQSRAVSDFIFILFVD